MRRSWTSPRLSGVRARAIAIALCLVPPAARGEVRVDGNPAAIRITTHQDSIDSVLAALRTRFRVQHRSAIALDMPANPTYAGPLDRVIANLLDSFNYIVKKSPAETEIIILGRHGEAAMPPPKPKLDLLSRWR
ncbi:MAG TPA: hypothetical protein VGG01_20455 [Xanthobacteraceae bacterium]|jgi:hypothetical protein